METRLMKTALCALSVFCFLLVPLSCARNPVSGEKEFMLLSDEDETRLGMKADAEITRSFGLYEDARLTGYLDGICQRMAKLSHRPRITYHLKIIDAPVVNAFAAPGGYVYFTRGILAAIDNEAELAGVMAHEIGHIAARHSAQQYSRAQVAQLGLIVPDLLGVPLVSGLTRLGMGVIFMGFSRDNERQADALSVEYATKAGFDAEKLAGFFETLERMNPGSDRSGLPAWFSTHPSPDDRIAAVRSQARDWKAASGARELSVNREVYLKAIDGLAYGEDPRQGYEEAGFFYHPGMRFQFPVPAGWKVSNTTTQVQMQSQKGDAAIIFTLAPGASPKEAAARFVSENRAKAIKSEALTISGLNALRLLADIPSKGGAIRLVSCFIQKGREVYVFHGITNPRLFDAYHTIFDDTSGGFRELSDQRKINRKPDLIRIRTATRADTLERTLRSLGVQENRLKEAVSLNGGIPGQTMKTGTLLKVIEPGR
jgi:predicted Zn-dependent protease